MFRPKFVNRAEGLDNVDLGRFFDEVDATKPQEIANTLWAYAKIRCATPILFDTLASRAVNDNMLWIFKPQELSNSSWAFATSVAAPAGLPVAD